MSVRVFAVLSVSDIQPIPLHDQDVSAVCDALENMIQNSDHRHHFIDIPAERLLADLPGNTREKIEGLCHEAIKSNRNLCWICDVFEEEGRLSVASHKIDEPFLQTTQTNLENIFSAINTTGTPDLSCSYAGSIKASDLIALCEISGGSKANEISKLREIAEYARDTGTGIVAWC